MEVRILRLGDEELLLALLAATEHPGRARDVATSDLADDALRCVVAACYDEVAGFAYAYALRRFGVKSLFIYSVDVVETFRRRGVAKAMLAALEGEAQRKNWAEMFVTTNTGNQAAMALYRSTGGVRPHNDEMMFDFYLDPSS